MSDRVMSYFGPGLDPCAVYNTRSNYFNTYSQECKSNSSRRVKQKLNLFKDIDNDDDFGLELELDDRPSRQTKKGLRAEVHHKFNVFKDDDFSSDTDADNNEKSESGLELDDRPSRPTGKALKVTVGALICTKLNTSVSALLVACLVLFFFVSALFIVVLFLNSRRDPSILIELPIAITLQIMVL
jgi:hypothetical protein